MNAITFYAILLLVSIHFVQSLKCRSHDPQEQEEHRRIVQKCLNGKSERSKSDDNSSTIDSSDSDDDDSSSDGSIYDHDFLSGNKKRNRDSNGNNNNKNNDKNDNNRRMENGSSRTSVNATNRNRNVGNQNGMQQHDENSKFSNDFNDSQQCIAQCIFDELNAVDQKGYPERIALTRTFNRKVQDPVLRDFQEESILECFHFLFSIPNLNKCEFSDYLLNCFIEKAQERCEDFAALK